MICCGSYFGCRGGAVSKSLMLRDGSRSQSHISSILCIFFCVNVVFFWFGLLPLCRKLVGQDTKVAPSPIYYFLYLIWCLFYVNEFLSSTIFWALIKMGLLEGIWFIDCFCVLYLFFCVLFCFIFVSYTYRKRRLV